jgi:hypothetical protein
LSEPILEEIDQRLHFRAELRENIKSAAILYSCINTLGVRSPSEYVKILGDYRLLAIKSVQLALSTSVEAGILHDYLTTWRHVKPKTTGNTLQALGLAVGPDYQMILTSLRNAWLDGKVKNPNEEKQLLESLVASISRGQGS